MRYVLDAWREKAACAGRATVMDPPVHKIGGEYKERAIAVCLGCPVLDECREWVMALPYRADPGGICAALTEGERARRRVAEKRCCRCRRVLPGTRFHASPGSTDGLKSDCIDCARDRKRAAEKEPQTC